MITVEGKEVLTELAELVDPRHAALVIIDMQCDFVSPGGLFDELGVDLSMYEHTIPRLAALLRSARRNGVLVVHIQNTALPQRMSDSAAHIRFNLRMHAAHRGTGAALRYTVPGTPGHDFIDELRPEPDELVVAKYRSSGFWGTNLELLLRSNGVKSLIIGGCTTEGCVESTARDAMFSDHYVVIAEDCVGSDDKLQHDASMYLMRHRFDLAASADISSLWDRRQPAAQAQG